MRAVGQAARADPSRHGVVRLVADGAREGVAGAARSEQRGVARRRGVRVLRGVSERLDQGQTPARFALEKVLVSGRSAPRGALKAWHRCARVGGARPDRGGITASRSGNSGLAALPARDEELWNRHRDFEQLRPGRLQVLARRSLVRVVRDGRDSAQSVRMISTRNRAAIGAPTTAKRRRGHGGAFLENCLGHGRYPRRRIRSSLAGKHPAAAGRHASKTPRSYPVQAGMGSLRYRVEGATAARVAGTVHRHERGDAPVLPPVGRRASRSRPAFAPRPLRTPSCGIGAGGWSTAGRNIVETSGRAARALLTIVLSSPRAPSCRQSLFPEPTNPRLVQHRRRPHVRRRPRE